MTPSPVPAVDPPAIANADARHGQPPDRGARVVAAGTPSLPIVTTPDPLAWAEAMGLPYLGEAS